ncbi:hypothetical protein HCX48_04390 [Rhodocyclus tenuis]|uniref:Uncharacterized protein n=2 Tax=Rhodocyclus TaxID=1064 RepID=A0A6L5JYZ9_RHOTE|nr:hypothetical protein [Rhodocyclus gracilis]MQY51884.1 hypothetical protein [Rhodocyclus gracilis]MRD73427.1 hypothetical protein [Rhodocyclus gracilis]NJA88463.1 hypothetical protein [Rhodocyclus gracilis]
MNIASTSAAYGTAATPVAQRSAEAAEVQKRGPDHDRDADDATAAVSAPAPTVNSSGQKVGQVINVTA